MRILIDMNLSPEWASLFERAGIHALHWSSVGDPRATDKLIMDWARAEDYVVFTHDLDFGALLATTRAQGPSVIQVRAQDIMVSSLGPRLLMVLRQYESILRRGALVTIDETKLRVHILPFA